ncbi:unnamed protein product [Ixodes pacificus]
MLLLHLVSLVTVQENLLSLELCKFCVHLVHPLQVGVLCHLFSGVMQSQVYAAFRNTSHEKDVVIVKRTS